MRKKHPYQTPRVYRTSRPAKMTFKFSVTWRCRARHHRDYHQSMQSISRTDRGDAKVVFLTEVEARLMMMRSKNVG